MRFWSENPFEIAAKQVREKPVPPSHHVDGLDPELEALILKGLAKTPAERFARAEELRDALAALEPRLSDERLSPRQGPIPQRPAGMPDPAPPDGIPPPMGGPLPDLGPPMPPPAPLGQPPLQNPAFAGGGFPHAAMPGMPGMTPLPPQVGPGPGQLLLGNPNMDPEAARQALLARARGGTIPMGAGLDAIVRQIHEDAAREGVPLDPSLRNLAGTPAQMQAQLQMQMQMQPPAGVMPGLAPPGRTNGGLVAVMVLASIMLGVGAGFAAYIFSR